MDISSEEDEGQENVVATGETTNGADEKLPSESGNGMDADSSNDASTVAPNPPRFAALAHFLGQISSCHQKISIAYLASSLMY
jgi:hypothetical protein